MANPNAHCTMESETAKSAALALAQAITQKLDLPVPFQSFSDFSSSFCVVVLERIFSRRLLSIHRPPTTKQEHLDNFHQVLNFLTHDLNIPVDSINPRSLLKKHPFEVHQVMNILAALAGVFPLSRSPQPARKPTRFTKGKGTKERRNPLTDADLHMSRLEKLRAALESEVKQSQTVKQSQAVARPMSRPPLGRKKTLSSSGSFRRIPKPKRPKSRKLNQSKLIEALNYPASSASKVSQSLFEYNQLSKIPQTSKEVNRLNFELSHLVDSFESVQRTSKSISNAFNRRNQHLDSISAKAKSFSVKREENPTSALNQMFDKVTRSTPTDGAFLNALKVALHEQKQLQIEEQRLSHEVARRAKESVAKASSDVEHQLISGYRAVQDAMKEKHKLLVKAAKAEKLENEKLKRERKERIHRLSEMLTNELRQFERKNERAARRLARLNAERVAMSIG
ncbi:hypothetical protein P9112_013968 [Eukaryota sp. TZLM1-RC]